MKGYELLKAISDREIKDGAKIEIKGRFSGDLKGSYFIYSEGHFGFPIYEPDGIKYSDSLEVHDLINFNFEVIEENKEIKKLNKISYNEFKYTDTKHRFDLTNIEYDKINELVREVNKINKQLEEMETSEISEEEINDAIKRAREYLESEEK